MINYACRHFKGSRPCVFNKRDGSECPSCRHASPYRDRILFIKLDAIGDVLRSASLLPAIVARHDAPYIAWLTRKESAELVAMMERVDEVVTLSEDGLARVISGGWHHVYSLSNDLTSASLASAAAARGDPVGFYMRGGIMTPSNEAAARWLEMAAFDRLKRENRQSYQQWMLAILGCPEAAIRAPALRVDEALRAAAAARIAQLFGDSRRQRVAVNIGSGSRWPKKMLYAEQIYHYARALRAKLDVDVLLVGGDAETDKAAAIMAMCGAEERIRPALTGHSIPAFVATLMEADALLCGDTLALHIATAIGLPTVAVFGPTSPDEIFAFDGLIAKTWTRQLDCLVCYGDCHKQRNCMSVLDIAELVELTVRQLQRRSRRGFPIGERHRQQDHA